MEIGDPFPMRPCGPNGLVLSQLGLGGAAIGRPPADGAGDAGASEARAVEAAILTVQAAYDLGVRHVDTSPAYGESERRIGLALASRDFPGLTLSTKVGTHPERRFRYGADDIRWSLENSLRVLGRPSVDLALIHDPPSMEPVFERGDGFAALRGLREEGLCANVGLGVHSHEFHRAAIDSGAVDVILTYGDFNVVRRSGARLMRYAREHGVGVLLGSPMMHGVLAFDAEPRASFEARPALLNWYRRADMECAQAWWEWCREREVSLRHLNMRFVMESDLPNCVLSGALTSDEIRVNAEEATTPVPAEVWSEALARIEELDAEAAARA